MKKRLENVATALYQCLHAIIFQTFYVVTQHAKYHFHYISQDMQSHPQSWRSCMVIAPVLRTLWLMTQKDRVETNIHMRDSHSVLGPLKRGNVASSELVPSE